MKIVGVMAMVMMILALGDKSVWSMEGGSSITPMKFSCQAQCGIKCVLANIAYPICFAVCVSKCPKQVNSVCITRCDRNKSITINIGIHSYNINLVFKFLSFFYD